MKRCSFFLQALASAFYFSFYFPMFFHLLVVVAMRCCYGGEACLFSDAEAEFKKQKSAFSVFACLST